MARVAGDVLLANLMSRTVDPVFGILAVVSKNLRVDVLRGGQSSCLLSVTLKFPSFNFLFSASGDADFAVDTSRSLTEEVVLSGYVARVTRKVFSGPSFRSLFRGESACSCLLERLVCHLLFIFSLELSTRLKYSSKI